MNYKLLPPESVILNTIKALESRNIEAVYVKDREAALEKLKELIPKNATVMTGSSTTLDQIGFIKLLKSGNHPWKNLKDQILAEPDKIKQAELRKQSILSDYFIGSVHAITEEGETITASASGSQIPSYAFASDNVIWVAGAQKIVPDLESGIKRVKDYVYPLEDQRMKSVGSSGSIIGWMLIFGHSILPNRKIKIIIVDEVLGF